MFKLCILEAGYINPALKDKYPPYSDLFKDFLKFKTRNWNVSSYRLYKSEFPFRDVVKRGITHEIAKGPCFGGLGWPAQTADC